jgi:hypothetical protein
MMKCVKCHRTFPDNTAICPDCSLFLIEDVTSDLSSRNPRRRVVHPEPPPALQPPLETPISPTGGLHFTASKERAVPTEPPRPSRVSRTGALRRALHRGAPFLTRLIPRVLLLIVILFLFTNWSEIRGFLQCIFIGGLLGAFLIPLLPAFFHGHVMLSSGVYAAGAILGAVTAFALQYNFLDITGAVSRSLNGGLLDALGPGAIVLLGIWLIFRSIR